MKIEWVKPISKSVKFGALPIGAMFISSDGYERSHEEGGVFQKVEETFWPEERTGEASAVKVTAIELTTGKAKCYSVGNAVIEVEGKLTVSEKN